MIVKLTLEYDGTNYCGWQIQPNGVSVQEKLQDALFELTGEKISVTGSGRTDSGVHAKGQVASFSTDRENIPAENYASAMNGLLPKDIRVIGSERAADDFNAVFPQRKKLIAIPFTSPIPSARFTNAMRRALCRSTWKKCARRRHC